MIEVTCRSISTVEVAIVLLYIYYCIYIYLLLHGAECNMGYTSRDSNILQLTSRAFTRSK